MAMLEAYNKRLAEEMEARKMVARMLHDYITFQKDLLAQAEETLEVCFICPSSYKISYLPLVVIHTYESLA